MTERGFYEQKRASPTGLAIVVLLHGAAITALAMSKMDMPLPAAFIRTDVELIRVKPDPAPIPPKPETDRPRTQPRDSVIDKPPARDPMPFTGPTVDQGPGDTIILDTTPPGKAESAPSDPIPLAPVRREARMESGSLLPPYPRAEQSSGIEGVVVFSVLIGTDGRVRAAEKVRATSDAFYRATERHAVRNWRFRPATIDGRPVESRKVMSVRFELNG